MILCGHRTAQEFAKAAAIAYTAVAVAVNISLILRPGELDLVSNPPWTRVAAIMAVFNFFDGVRQLLLLLLICVCHNTNWSSFHSRQRGSSL